MAARQTALLEAARKLEHENTMNDPEITEEARRLVAKANGLRKARAALLYRSGLR